MAYIFIRQPSHNALRSFIIGSKKVTETYYKPDFPFLEKRLSQKNLLRLDYALRYIIAFWHKCIEISDAILES